jgi:hypothetical protein
MTMTIKMERPAFTPEALSNFDLIMNEVFSELRAEHPRLVGPSEQLLRTKLARKMIVIAGAGRSNSQIKQLLLRTIRNEWSAARHRFPSRSFNVRREPQMTGSAPA